MKSAAASNFFMMHENGKDQMIVCVFPSLVVIVI